jgi:hypothetical protein
MAAIPKDILKNTALWASLKKQLDENNAELWDEVWSEVGKTAFQLGEKSAFETLRLKWKQDPTRAQRYFDKHGLDFVEELSETDIDWLRQAIATNWGIGEKPFGKLVEDRLGSEYRGKLIYRQEIHTAHEKASMATAEDLGAKWSVWVAVMDQRTRDAHWESNGQIQPFGQPFKLVDPKGEEYESEPGDEIACRCRALHFMTLKEALNFVASLGSEVSNETNEWNASLEEEV